jgi:hypothetical protein
MPKKIVEEEVYEPEPELETENENEPIRISKRTGKPVRPLTELQKETLAKGRAIGVQKKKELVEGIDKNVIKKHKEEIHRQKVEKNKQIYEDALKQTEKEEEIQVVETPPPPQKTEKNERKIKKKVIKYVEASDSDSEEEEVIVRRRRKEPKQRDDDIPEKILRQKLKNNLEDIKASSLSQMLMPSYY